ncbi:FAD-binding oxidoreductase [Bordetella bronchialis]|uniref:FAD-binding oxidoreductase n=1 Tax=Bordetella bronchialis TaxID=463025 RepID=UPI003D076050
MNDLTDPAWLRRPVPAACLESLRAIVGDRLSTARAVREHHGHDESPYPDVLPDAVIFAETTDEVAAVARVCNDHRVPIVAYGAGSSLEGHLLPVQGGITLDLSRMNAVLAVHAEDFTATVQAGVTRKQLNEHLRDSGLFFPVDPGADASLGGMAATRASGTNAVRYGTMRENVLSLTVVTADGRVLRTARRAPKSSAGYDLTRIFVGSEGTLGIITEVTVKLYPQPEAVSAAVCNFPTLGDAVDSVIEIMQAGVPVARVEFMDEHAVRSVNRYSQLTLRETPLLLFEFHGSAAGVQEQAAAVQAIVHEHGGMDFEWAHRPEDRSRLWAARHNAYFAGLQLRPGCRSSTTDVCVPISALAECVRETARDLAEAPFPTTIVGHVGDGNFHVLMLLDPDSQEEWDASERINHALVRRAIAADGTCTGEHGVGLHKMGFLLEEHGTDALDLMRSLKHAFDPNNILNPGKIVSW